jgi:hypothetical protein
VASLEYRSWPPERWVRVAANDQNLLQRTSFLYCVNQTKAKAGSRI